MFNKIKEFNDKNVSLYFFLAIMFLIVALFVNRGNKNVNDTKIEDNNSNDVKISRAYTYDIKLNKNNEVILFTIKVFNGKYLMTKTEKGIESTYYIHYSDIYEKDLNDNYILLKGNNFVEGIDNKLLFLDYIKDIVDESNQIADDTDNCLLNSTYNFTICSNESGYDIKSDIYELNYKVYDVDKTEDFNIVINNEM